MVVKTFYFVWIKIWRGIRYWGQIFLIPMFLFSYIFPRCKNIWVFGSTFGYRFTDNPKYFYLFLNQDKNISVRAIWITKSNEIKTLLRSHGMEVYNIYSAKGIWYSLRAKVYLYDNYSKDICFWLSGGATKINLWHGIPLKKINQDNKFDKVRNPENKVQRLKWFLRRLSDEKPSHYVLTTSITLVPIFSSAFGTKNIIICGYPRNELFLNNSNYNIVSNEEKLLIDKICNYGKKIILYLPTFRQSETKIFDIITMDVFNDFLIKHDMLFCIKPHHKSFLNQNIGEKTWSNILKIDSIVDPYPLLNITDVLVTDYSSIYFDFLLRDKPIVFFDYDREEYICNSRELYFDYDSYTPGPKAKNMFDLMECLENISVENMSVQRNLIKEKVFDSTVGSASFHLYELIKEIINLD